jgi:hypothetical protein
MLFGFGVCRLSAAKQTGPPCLTPHSRCPKRKFTFGHSRQGLFFPTVLALIRSSGAGSSTSPRMATDSLVRRKRLYDKATPSSV